MDTGSMSEVALSRARVRGEASARPLNMRRLVRRSALYLVLAAGAAYMAFPFFWMLLTSVKSHNEALASSPALPRIWHFDNYVRAWQAAPFTRYFANTFL